MQTNQLNSAQQLNNVQLLLTQHLGIWTSAETEKKSGRGRASGNAGSVYGIKKLRELILELAVRGKLVPQDANDEPASELLKRIQAEKAKLILEGKLKKEKPLAPISEEEKPFELPNGWECVRLGGLGDWGAGATPLRSISSYYGGAMPWFKSGELSSDFIDVAEETITELALKECSLRLNQPGDVLIAMYGATIGKAAILNVAATTNQAVCACTPNGSIFNIYLLVLLKAMKPNFIGQGAGGAQPNISREKIIATITALPPINEQHRIVAKVDALMALCDQLENQHLNGVGAHETLVSELLATLTQSQDTADFNANWQRIYAHFDVLFTTQASIAALKQTLLQLAVMGKLVPQDPNDEPASDLLKRIQAEKAKLILEGKLKKEKSLEPIGDDEKPFELPKGWEWVKLSDVSTYIQYGFTDSANQTNREVLFLRITDIQEDFVDWSKVPGCNSSLNQVQDYLLSENDIVIARTGGTIGKSYLVSNLSVASIFASYLIRIGKIESINHKFKKLYFGSLLYWNQLYANSMGTGQPNVNGTALKGLLFSLPPIQEQHRIVAKVDALMALCDQLKTCVQQASQQQQVIADALVAQAVFPQPAEVIDFAQYRTAVACYTLKKMSTNPAFGRTQAMKLLYLAQNHVGLKLQLQFEREAAGPLDKWIYDFERQAEQAQWFTVAEKTIGAGKTKVEYQIKSAIVTPSSMLENLCSIEQRKELDRLFGLFANKNTEEAEIIATLFAVWNDFLIDGITLADAQIIKEVRENWHESKARFSPAELTKWLNWMRVNHLVPKGHLPRTVYQQSLIN